METKKSGLTVVEILVVLGIIALLVGMLLPAVHTVQKMAKETKQKAQFTAIELGLAAFKNDYGDYPPSEWWNPSGPDPRLDRSYCGSQKLAEALLGWDLLGFHPNSAWRADGLDSGGGPGTYDPLRVNPPSVGLEKRKDRYIDLDTANVFRLGPSALGDGLYLNTGQLAPNTHVLCDVFTVNAKKIVLGPGKTVSPGTPILYYKANPVKKRMNDLVTPENNIYNARDNWPLITLRKLADGTTPHPLEGTDWTPFYEYIRDPKVQARPWPYRPDSYILISAGADGLYGTDDDIRNFGQ